MAERQIASKRKDFQLLTAVSDLRIRTSVVIKIATADPFGGELCQEL